MTSYAYMKEYIATHPEYKEWRREYGKKYIKTYRAAGLDTWLNKRKEARFKARQLRIKDLLRRKNKTI